MEGVAWWCQRMRVFAARLGGASRERLARAGLEPRRQDLSDGTVKNRTAHLRWLAKKIGKPGIVRGDYVSYGVGARCAP